MPGSCPPQMASDCSTLLVAESEFARSVNSGTARAEILSSLLGRWYQLGYAKGMILTLKPWRGIRPQLVAEQGEGPTRYWPAIRELSEIDRAHSGGLWTWDLHTLGATNSSRCISFCFSSPDKGNGRGAVALTGLDPIRPEPMLELRNVFSDPIESLLIRDGILARRAAGGPLLDMADCISATLGEAQAVLAGIGNSTGTDELVARAQRAELLVKIRELCRYTHIDSGLAELSSSLLVLARTMRERPPAAAQIGALRYAFECMNAIALPHGVVDECLDRLEEAGLDVYDAFGEDEDDQD
ncbi:MAG: hypothetical protein FJ291_05725 [Planctomycetes bacterium]|nr:hypothetical protein [Planctomycetota bacterium]